MNTIFIKSILIFIIFGTGKNTLKAQASDKDAQRVADSIAVAFAQKRIDDSIAHVNTVNTQSNYTSIYDEDYRKIEYHYYDGEIYAVSAVNDDDHGGAILLEEYSSNKKACNYWFDGNNKQYNGNNIGAIQDYNKAIGLNPFFGMAYVKRGYSKSELEDYRGAIADYNTAIELNPKNIAAYYERGYVKGELEDYRGSIQDYNKVIELDPSSSDAYSNLGVSKGRLKDYQGAIQAFNKSIELNPKEALAYYNRGLNKLKAGDKNGGCLDFSKAGELGFEDAYETIKEKCN